MLLRGLLAAAVLFAGAFLSARFLSDPSDWSGTASTDRLGHAERTFSLAPFSLGHPAAAAGLQTLTESVPHEPVPAADPFRYSYPLQPETGDTLAGLLTNAGITRADAIAAIDALRPLFDPRHIRPGQDVTLTFERSPADGADTGRFVGLVLVVDHARDIVVARASETDFTAEEIEKTLTRTPARVTGEISRSLFLDGEKAGLPVAVLIELIRMYSWDVDFQRDIWPGDGFEVLYERLYDDSGVLVHTGGILYASLTLTGTRHPLYRFETADRTIDYFDDNGRSARKALMRTPIDGARLSSRYGKRRHPILGYNKMHRGVDFAAPIGTPIYAAGDGRVDSAGWNGGYGRYIRIRHNSEYATAYGHMTRLARGIAAGRRVRQGQVIGYVGNTGRSTGPHLHYEIFRAGRQVNPFTVRMPSGRRLKGSDLARFQGARTETDRLFAALPDQTELAGRAE